MTISARQAIADLSSTTCPACKKTKKARQTFCRSCYYKLPISKRQDLYKRVGEGYEEAYEALRAMLADLVAEDFDPEDSM